MFYVIYKITNKISKKIYIGKHQTKELNDGYMGSGKHLRHAIARYGVECFEKEILFLFDNEADMNAKEAELVTEEFCLREDTYNLCPGGRGGFGYINGNAGIIAKRDTYENKVSGRAAANEKIKQKYGSLSNLAKIANSFGGMKGARAFSEKYKSDDDFKNDVTSRLKEANQKSQSEESKQKRKQTMAANGHSKGSKNSQFGKRWIFSVDEKRSVKIDKLEPLPDGWYEGRKIKF